MFLKTNLLILLFSLTAFGQGRQVGKFDVIESHGTPKNHIKNPYARNNTLGTSTSSATIARDTDAADKLDGLASFVCDSSATNGYCAWQTLTIPEGDKTGNCQASFMYKGDASLYSIRVTDTTNTLTDVALTNASDWTLAGPVSYPCAASRDIRLVQTTAGTGPAVNVGRVIWEKAEIGSVAQAEVMLLVVGNNSTQSIADATAAKVTNWSETIDTYNAFTSNTFTVPKSGYIKVGAGVRFQSLSSPVRTNLTVYKNGLGAPAGADVGGTTWNNPQVNSLFQVTAGDLVDLYIFQDSSGSANIDGASGVQYMHITYYPSASEQAIRPTDAAWYVDANIAGANPSLGTSAVSSYTEITNASLTLTPASGSAPVGAMCSSTNAATTPSTSATTCAAGSESVGFNVSIPKAGVYEVCGYFGHEFAANSASSVSAVFQFVETATNAQTILQESRTRTNSYSTIGGSNYELGMPHSNCGLFTFASAGTKGLRLMYEQVVSGTPTISRILGDELAAAGQRNIRITMKPFLAATPAPLLVGSVTYNDTVKAEGANGLNTVAFGSFTPTLTNGTNVAASTIKNCSYARIGNIVTGRCWLGITCTAASGTVTTVGISLPVASTFSTGYEVGGHVTGVQGAALSESGIVFSASSPSRITSQFTCTSTAALQDRIFSFQYTVQ